jgi:hypothetical protein
LLQDVVDDEGRNHSPARKTVPFTAGRKGHLSVGEKSDTDERKGKNVEESPEQAYSASPRNFY